MDALQLVAEPRRREILRLVWDDERAVGDLAAELDLSYGGVSQHLSLLRAAGFVTVRRDGKRRFYRADHAQLGPLKDFLEPFWTSSVDRLARLAEKADRS